MTTCEQFKSEVLPASRFSPNPVLVKHTVYGEVAIFASRWRDLSLRAGGEVTEIIQPTQHLIWALAQGDTVVIARPAQYDWSVPLDVAVRELFKACMTDLKALAKNQAIEKATKY